MEERMERWRRSGSPELSFTGRCATAEAVSLRLYPVRVCSALAITFSTAYARGVPPWSGSFLDVDFDPRSGSASVPLSILILMPISIRDGYCRYFFYRICKGQTSMRTIKSSWSPPSIDVRDPKTVTSGSPALQKGVRKSFPSLTLRNRNCA
ncbi:hypothetical protein EVAR_92990_1 [Eumeta japonica]|uniref:Uncharacterized protein n=1 Tax=Eumeta variegata TaxID=151549 RepID=A0A4C1TBF5_EUMVA|nr:hypothetical protein EVAR_92990_1 [Eumeta japonica]